MKNFIKSLVFMSVTSSLLLSSIAWGASARSTANAAEAKVSSTARRIIQYPGLLQHKDRDLYDKRKISLSVFYTAFFITKMMDFAKMKDAFNSGNYDLLVDRLADRGKLDEFCHRRSRRLDIEAKEILAILGQNKVANVCSVAIDMDGVFCPPVLQALEALELGLNKPIGLAINVDEHWIAGMVTIGETGVVLRVVNSLGDDCTKLPIVTKIYDYFVQRVQRMKLAAADLLTIARANSALDAEEANARKKLVQQQEEKIYEDEKEEEKSGEAFEREAAASYAAAQATRVSCAASDAYALRKAYVLREAMMDSLPQSSSSAIAAAREENKLASATASSSSTTTNLRTATSSLFGSISSSISSSSLLHAPAAASAAMPAVDEKEEKEEKKHAAVDPQTAEAMIQALGTNVYQEVGDAFIDWLERQQVAWIDHSYQATSPRRTGTSSSTVDTNAIAAAGKKDKLTSAAASSSSATTNSGAAASSSSGSTSSSISSSSSSRAPAASSAATQAVEEKEEKKLAAAGAQTAKAVIQASSTNVCQDEQDALTELLKNSDAREQDARLSDHLCQATSPTKTGTSSSTVATNAMAAAEEKKESKAAGERFRQAICKQKGLGCTSNEEEAHKLFLQIAEDYPDYTLVQSHIGAMYLKGECGFDRDAKEAVKLFTLTAQKDDLDGLLYLGYCLSKGLGIKENSTEAKKMFRRAAALYPKDGHEKVSEWYSNLESEFRREHELEHERKVHQEALASQAQAQEQAQAQTQALRQRELDLQRERQEFEKMSASLEQEKRRSEEKIVTLTSQITKLQDRLRAQLATVKKVQGELQIQKRKLNPIEQQKRAAEAEANRSRSENDGLRRDLRSLQEMLKRAEAAQKTAEADKQKEAEKVAKEIKRLAEEKEVLEKRLSASASEVKAAEEKAATEAARDALSCRICMANQKDRVFIRCGHCVCHACLDGLENNPAQSRVGDRGVVWIKCPECREECPKGEIRPLFI